MKKVFLLVAVLFGMMAVQADVLYWQITNPTFVEDSMSFDDNIDTSLYTYATFYTVDADGKATALTSSLNATTSSEVVSISGAPTYYVDITDSYSANTFYIELYASNTTANDVYYRSESISYADIQNFTAGVENMKTWNPSTFSAVPEPTSGMLLMLGAALLALKRRKVA